MRILGASLVIIHKSTKSPFWLSGARYPASNPLQLLTCQLLGTNIEPLTTLTQLQNVIPASNSPCNFSRLCTSRVLGRPFKTEVLRGAFAASLPEADDEGVSPCPCCCSGTPAVSGSSSSVMSSTGIALAENPAGLACIGCIIVGNP